MIDVDVLRTALAEAEESKLCNDCLADVCVKHDQMPEASLGCGDAELIAEWYRAAYAHKQAADVG